MIREVIMPQLAMGMSEGDIVEWLVAEGANIERDTPLVSIETEKVVTDVPSSNKGYLHICISEGETVPVESVIAQLAETREEYEQLVNGSIQAVPVAETVQQQASNATVESVTDAPALDQKRLKVSGLARKIAAQNSVELAGVIGTGPGGRIVRKDVVNAMNDKSTAISVPSSITQSTVTEGPREKARIPLTGMRKTIAARMLQSKTTAANTYVFFEIDVTKLVAAREVMNAKESDFGSRISWTAIYAKALAQACQYAPICNSTLVNDEIIVWDSVNVGIAVATPGKGEYDSGLMVPVVCNVQAKGLVTISNEIKGLVERAKAGQLGTQDMSDGTVTLSSTSGFLPGQWCVSTPLLNQPQVLNFQPGSIIEKPVVVDGEVVIRSMLPCGLTFDHRAVDGEPVARFNRKISDFLSNPELMLM